MVRTLVLACLVTLFGATASEAQYRDSYPPEDSYDEEYETESRYEDSYDEELLGPRDDRYDDDYDDDRYYSEPDIDVGIFANLGHDGRWHLTAGLGWVWRPYAATSWRPYSAGRWVWTSYGWTWVSYEPFGWATYHYGSWAQDPMLGWVWIPGYEWAACRVQFAYYDDYIAWAPLMPAGYHCPQPWSPAGIHVWFTVGASRFCDPYPTRYCETPRYTSVYAERVRYKSPDRGFVERHSGQPVRQAKVNFKHTSWSKGSSKAAKFESKGPSRVTTKSRATKSGTRTFSSPSAGKRNDRVAVKSKPSRQVTRELRAPARSTQRQTIKLQRETRRVAMEQPRREQRVSKSIRVSRSSSGDRKSISVDRRSSDRRGVTQERRFSRREVVKSRKSSDREGRGKVR